LDGCKYLRYHDEDPIPDDVNDSNQIKILIDRTSKSIDELIDICNQMKTLSK